jgi:hypothetical protein
MLDNIQTGVLMVLHYIGNADMSFLRIANFIWPLKEKEPSHT